jgi:hypothetical protein
MAAIPLNTVVDAVRNRLTSQCAGVVTPDPVFGKAAPLTILATDDVLAYVLHLRPDDVQHATGGLYRRTHAIQIRLWVRTPDDASETAFLTLCDRIDAAFFAFQGLGLGATLHSATLTVPDLPPYIRLGDQERRQRVWHLAVVEDYTAPLAF